MSVNKKYKDLFFRKISKHNYNRYGTKLIKLPTPQYVVFYNGTKDVDDTSLLRLSDSFQVSQNQNAGEIYEWTAKMININFGHNQELMQKCKPLADYAELIEIIRQSVQTHGVEAGVKIGIDTCIARNLFKDILLKNKSEVIGMFLTHYDQQEQIQIERAEAKAEGEIEARNLINELNNLLVNNNRIEDLKRSVVDLDFQNELLIEFGLIEK